MRHSKVFTLNHHCGPCEIIWSRIVFRAGFLALRFWAWKFCSSYSLNFKKIVYFGDNNTMNVLNSTGFSDFKWDRMLPFGTTVAICPKYHSNRAFFHCDFELQSKLLVKLQSKLPKLTHFGPITSIRVPISIGSSILKWDIKHINGTTVYCSETLLATWSPKSNKLLAFV